MFVSFLLSLRLLGHAGTLRAHSGLHGRTPSAPGPRSAPGVRRSGWMPVQAGMRLECARAAQSAPVQAGVCARSARVCRSAPVQAGVRPECARAGRSAPRVRRSAPVQAGVRRSAPACPSSQSKKVNKEYDSNALRTLK